MLRALARPRWLALGVWYVGIELNLNSEKVERLLDGPPLCVEPSTSVRDVLTLLKQNNQGSVLICRQQKLIGIFSERDALRYLARQGNLDAPVEQHMSASPITIRAGDSVAEAVRRMVQGGYRRLPVVNAQDVPLGIVKVSAIVHYLVQHFPKTVYNLPPQAGVAVLEREGP